MIEGANFRKRIPLLERAEEAKEEGNKFESEKLMKEY